MSEYDREISAKTMTLNTKKKPFDILRSISTQPTLFSYKAV